MVEKINIVEILKDKPQGTKLYSSACGKCKLEEVDDKSFKISFYNSKFGFMNGGEGYLDKNGKLYDDGECIIFPSKEMRDWNKFAWQKGDILVNENNAHIIFEKFTDDTYTTFIGRHYLNKNYKNYVPGRYTCVTQHFHIEESNAAQIYIYNIEEKIGGKLDLKTLEIEKTKCEFKTFDKVLVRDRDCDLWQISLFGYKNHNCYHCSNGYIWYQCIPYEGNEHLLGTTDNFE